MHDYVILLYEATIKFVNNFHDRKEFKGKFYHIKITNFCITCSSCMEHVGLNCAFIELLLTRLSWAYLTQFVQAYGKYILPM